MVMGLFDKLREPVFLKESNDAKSQLEQLTELHKTAPDSVKKQVEQDIKMLSYGIGGEEKVAFELMNSFMPMYILHDLYYEYDGLTAQIDFLVVTRKVVLLIECKNLIGNIEVTSNGEFIRTMEFGSKKVREGIYSPITQNQRHLALLKTILRERRSNIITKALFDKFFYDNYKSIVVLANPKTLINMKYSKKEVKEQIIRSDQLIDFIKKLNSQNDLPSYNDKEMHEMAEIFLGYHSPNTKDYTSKYGLVEVEADKITETVPSEKLEDSPVYQELKHFRYNRSKEENVKPYFIYNNSQMEELIKLMPKSIEEIILISGFGEVKCEKYGEQILRILNQYR